MVVRAVIICGVLSVVIPTLNESANLRVTIPHARAAARGAAVEVIVSDCDSRDGTACAAQELGAIVTTGAACRADALNRGARLAGGDVIVFLHADTLLPDDFVARVRRALARPGVVGGAFDFQWQRLDGLGSGLAWQQLKLVRALNRIRFRWTHNFYGDQAIFVRRAAFERAGGFPAVALMEDVRFCRRLRRLGRVAIVSPAVRTSPRRFVARGVFRQLGRDLILLACDSVGATPTRMWGAYNGLNGKPH
jgi:rSAM/selenodomain-associated transferase 2